MPHIPVPVDRMKPEITQLTMQHHQVDPLRNADVK